MRYRTILLAIDIEAENSAVIDYAFAFAEKAGATLHTLYAYPVGVAPPGGTEDAYYADLRDRAKKEMDRAVAKHAGSSSMGKTYVDMNEPISSITVTAEKLDADMIMVSTRSREGMERLALGSVAQGVLEEAKVPVLVLKSTPTASTDFSDETD